VGTSNAISQGAYVLLSVCDLKNEWG
jgi:hypothetical protein